MGYIDADKLKELIDEKWKELADKNVKVGGGKWDIEISIYLSVLRLIDSLQQEQSARAAGGELRSELEKYIFSISVETMKKEPFTQLEKCAHYFYNLGLNTRKKE